MIVKNEAHVIRRCLASVRGLVDAYCVVDTGSTDGTQDIVREAMRGVPGAVYERPWKNFGHNRTEALELARPWADYSFIIDADEEMVLPPGYALPELTLDAYLTPHRGEGSKTSFYRTQIVRSSLPWRYVGVLHEVIQCDAPHETGKVHDVLCVGHFDSARNQGDVRQKYARDAEVLERGLVEEPDNARYVFYLAQSYRDAGEPERAISNYRRRAALGGWPEEVFYSFYQAGLLCEAAGRHEEAVSAWLDAYAARPTRREPLVALARHYRTHRKFPLAYLFAKKSVELPRPDDLLFLQDEAYDWRAEDEVSVAAFWVGEYRESLDYAGRLLASSRLPSDQRERVEKNRQFAADKLAAGAR